jgi:hypothetical protein
MGTVVLEYPQGNVKRGYVFFEEILNLPSTSEMVVEPSTEVIVAKASGSFAIDSFTIPLPEIGLELIK